MSGHWESVFHPQRRSKPPQYRGKAQTYRTRRTIGEERGGIFACWEYAYYFVYISDDVPSANRFFELRVRIPLRKWQSPKMMEKVIAAKADELMTDRGIDTDQFDKKSVGIRQVGLTKSKRGRWILINKATKESWPKTGWGYFD